MTAALRCGPAWRGGQWFSHGVFFELLDFVLLSMNNSLFLSYLVLKLASSRLCAVRDTIMPSFSTWNQDSVYPGIKSARIVCCSRGIIVHERSGTAQGTRALLALASGTALARGGRFASQLT